MKHKKRNTKKRHTKNALRKIRYAVHHIKNPRVLFKRVNWVIVHSSHNISKKRGSYGHRIRQKIRHRLWKTAKQKYPSLRKYIIPREITGKIKCRIKSAYSTKYKPVSPTVYPKKVYPKKEYPKKEYHKIYYHRNIPALIAAAIIGVFIALVPVIERKTIYDNTIQILTYFNPESVIDVNILISVLLVIVIFCFLLLNGLGFISNKYSKYAGYLSLLYFLNTYIANVFFVQTTTPVSVFEITPISYWIASYGVSIIGIVYLVFFEAFKWDKYNRWKVVFFPIICIIALFLTGILMPIPISSTKLLMTEQFGISNYSTNSWHQADASGSNSQYHVGEIATNQNGQRGMAIISDDGQEHYTVVPVFLDISQKGWHTNGKVDPQIVTYQSVEQNYPIRWSGGRMDISHIPDRDWTIAPSSGSLSYTVITTPPTIRIPTTTQKTAVTTITINEIINKHNYYRRSVIGASIPNIEWSASLASSAQTWANYLGANNLFQHSSGHSENIAAGYSSWTAAIDGWASEKSNFIYAPFGNGASSTGNWQDVGHYTQIIWKSTTQCGCGSAPHPKYGTVYVCHYTPAGNVVGFYPY